MLGVPVLLQIDKEYCYVTEQQEAGLIRRFEPGDDAVAAIDRSLAEDPASFRKRARAFVASKGDLNDYILRQIVRVAREHGSGAKAR